MSERQFPWKRSSRCGGGTCGEARIASTSPTINGPNPTVEFWFRNDNDNQTMVMPGRQYEMLTAGIRDHGTIVPEEAGDTYTCPGINGATVPRYALKRLDENELELSVPGQPPNKLSLDEWNDLAADPPTLDVLREAANLVVETEAYLKVAATSLAVGGVNEIDLPTAPSFCPPPLGLV